MSADGRLVRLSRRLGEASGEALLAWLERQQRRGAPCFAWLERGRGLFGAGLCGRWSADDLTQLSSLGSGITEQAGLGDLPAVFVAATFDGRRDSIWSGCPAAELVAPEVVLERTAEGAVRAVAQAWVRGEDDAGVLDRLSRRLAGLRLRGVLRGDSELRGPPLGQRVDLEPRSSYEARVRAALAEIERGRCEKVVLARGVRWTRLGGAFSALATLARLERAHPDAISFLWSDPLGGEFLGATPEVLARVQGGRLSTHALAGTAALERAAELEGRAKDAREHSLTSAGIAADLRATCEEVRVGAPRLRRLRRLAHLETPVEARLRAGAGLLDVAAALHPTPAVCGWPREQARPLLAHEPLVRGRYAAPLGWLAPCGDGALAVGLRSALLRGRQAWAFAGAGIVRGSEPRAEWEETELKLGSVELALAREGALVQGKGAAS